MLQRRLVPVVAGLTLISLGALGCTDDSGSDEGNDEVGETATTDDTTTDTGDTTETSDTGTTEESTDGTTDTTDDTTEDESTETGPPACDVWEITYDLDGSLFRVESTINFEKPVEAPYDGDDTVGPGTVVVRFQDVDGAPGGTAALVSYEMSMHFLSGIPVIADVQTDLENSAGPDGCGLSTGPLGGTTVVWDPSAIVGHHSVGQIVCNGGGCGAGGLPNGDPVPVDEVSDQPVNPFVFSEDLSSFTMAEILISSTERPPADSFWSFQGTEVSRELVGAPECLCP